VVSQRENQPAKLLNLSQLNTKIVPAKRECR
jgi:hypothetical protein